MSKIYSIAIKNECITKIFSYLCMNMFRKRRRCWFQKNIVRLLSIFLTCFPQKGEPRKLDSEFITLVRIYLFNYCYESNNIFVIKFIRNVFHVAPSLDLLSANWHSNMFIEHKIFVARQFEWVIWSNWVSSNLVLSQSKLVYFFTNIRENANTSR